MKALLTLTLVLAAGWPGAQALAQDRMLTLSERVARLERQVGGGGAGGDMVANLVVEVRSLKKEVRRLRGEIQELKHEIKGIKARQRDQYLDLDRRLRKLGGKLGAGAGSSQTAPSTPDAAQSRAPSTGTRKPQSGTPSPSASTRSPGRAPAPDAAPAPQRRAVPATPTPGQEAAYEAAKDLLLQSRFADAAAAFRHYLEMYPRGSLSDNAQYWLGESYYATGNYDLALDAFQKVLSRYPNSNKRSGALLKIGYSYFELGQMEQARTTLNKVINRYPNTSEARLARERLQLLRLKTADQP